MDIVFDKNVQRDLNEALDFEWMDRNQTGAYSSSTLCGMNTRREHGLFVSSSSDQTKKVVLLSKLEESVFIGNSLYEISTNQFPNNIFPQGFKNLIKFSLNPFPRSVFKIDDRILQRTLFWIADRNILAVRYELKNQGNPIKLIIKPFITARYNQGLTHEIQGMNTDSYLSHHSVRWAPLAYMPQLHAYFLAGSYSAATLWYHKFYYKKDKNRFKGHQEDLLNPGFFEATLNPYETFDLFFSTDDLTENELDYEALHRAELKRRGLGIMVSENSTDPAVDFRNQLRLSRYDFNKKLYPALSSINFTRNLREIIFSLPGIYLAEKNNSEFKIHFRNIVNSLEEGLLPSKYPKMEEPKTFSGDLSLWLIDLAYKYFSESNDIKFFKYEIYDSLRLIIDHFIKGTRFNIYKDSDSLLFVGDRKNSLSWQFGAIGEGDSVRYGKLLEINALWYNALCIMTEFSKKLDKNRYVTKYKKLSDKVKKSFNKFFINDESSFYDWIRNGKKNSQFTINQLIPLGLNFRCCEDDVAEKVLKRIEKELLTPLGMRLFTKKDAKTSGQENDYSKHLIKTSVVSLYIQACMNYKVVSHDTLEFFDPLIDLAKSGLLGFIPEYVTTDEEHHQVGILDYSPVLADWIWAEYLFSKQ